MARKVSQVRSRHEPLVSLTGVGQRVESPQKVSIRIVHTYIESIVDRRAKRLQRGWRGRGSSQSELAVFSPTCGSLRPPSLPRLPVDPSVKMTPGTPDLGHLKRFQDIPKSRPSQTLPVGSGKPEATEPHGLPLVLARSWDRRFHPTRAKVPEKRQKKA